MTDVRPTPGPVLSCTGYLPCLTKRDKGYCLRGNACLFAHSGPEGVAWNTQILLHLKETYDPADERYHQEQRDISANLEKCCKEQDEKEAAISHGQDRVNHSRQVDYFQVLKDRIKRVEDLIGCFKYVWFQTGE